MTYDLANRMPPNPSYGGGYFVRATRFRRLGPDRVEAVMEDPFHALAMVVTHDDKILQTVEARWERNPLTSCMGAEIALTGLEGLPLITDLRTRWLQAQPALHCTHLFDTLRLVAMHAALDRPDRGYEVVLPDTQEPAQPVQLFRDGELALEIAIDDSFRIVSPAQYAGAPLLAGFARWAADRLTAEEFEQLFILQRGAFVGRGQKFDLTQFYGREGELSGPPAASCFGSQPERYAGSVRVANARPGLRREDAARFPYA